MQIANLIMALPGAAAQGLIWGIMAIGVYLTFRVLDIADLTVDGTMCTGGAVCVMMMTSGHNVWVSLLVATLAGMTAGLVTGERISETQYRIRLNDPGVIDLHRPACGFDCSYIELGNPGIPHAVVMVDDWDKKPEDELRKLGRALRFDPAFPKGANVSFAKLTGRDCIKAITYERGVEDFTLACGTGSGSIATVASLKGLVSGGDIRIQMPGGDLYISLTEESGRVRDIFLTGPTCVVFTGETYLV